MPMTTEERIELLKKARERKAEIKKELDARKPPSVKGRPPKKVVEETKSLDLTEKLDLVDEKPVEKPVEKEDHEDEVDEVEEQIVYEKIPKKKKKIVRKIIRQVESSSDEEVEEQIIYEKPRVRTQQARPHQVERPRPQTPPRQVEVEPVRNPFFNY